MAPIGAFFIQCSLSVDLMNHYSSQSCFWFDYHADATRTEVLSHAQDHCTYAVTELIDENGEGWNFRLQLLQQGPQSA